MRLCVVELVGDGVQLLVDCGEYEGWDLAYASREAAEAGSLRRWAEVRYAVRWVDGAAEAAAA